MSRGRSVTGHRASSAATSATTPRQDATATRVLEEIYATGLVVGAHGQRARPLSDGGIGREQGQLLYDLVRQEEPRVTLEVGFALGLSALFICQGLRDAGGSRHIVIDPHQTSGFDRLGLDNIAAAGFTGLLDFYEESSHRVLPRLEAAGLNVDLAFIDGSHLFDLTLLEFFYIDRMLRPEGLIILDDISLPAVAKVVRFAVTNRSYVEESAAPDTGRLRAVGRRVRRLGHGLAALPAAVAFASGSERRETLPRELPRRRRRGLGVLRKQHDDDRHWLSFRPF
jgi:predicted O-methyltransferase YrrM